MSRTIIGFVGVAALVLAGCSSPSKPESEKKSSAKSGDHDHDHDHDHGEENQKEGGGHAHTAPHGGTLVVLGEGHFAHLEVGLVASTGELRVWFLDGEAEQAVRVTHKSWPLKITPPQGEAFTIDLHAVENPLTGEKTGDTSEFVAQDERLKNLKAFDAETAELEVKGTKVPPTKFNFPKGNEDAGDHDHDHAH